MTFLSSEDFMNVKRIISNSRKPAPYTSGTAQMWVDEYISTQLLQVHLDQKVDLASRKESTIKETVNWILEQVEGSQLQILDLGCGPGLYAEKLAEKGHQVTGIDFSAKSIEYAKESAQKNNLDIGYWKQDYLTLDGREKYDLVIMIFTDFGVLTPAQRTDLIARIYKILKPKGTFICDVLNPKTSFDANGARNWEMVENGFWRPTPYLTLSESLYYEKENVTLNQHIVIEESGGYEIYRFWVHTFSHSDLEAIFLKAGFNTVSCYEKVVPDSELCSSESVTFSVARK